MRRALPAAIAAAALALSACTAGGSGGVSLTKGLSWHACPSDGSSAQCTQVKVPVNYADPGGRKITLALSEVPATAPPSQRQGVLLVNPGGPGGSGLSLASFVANGLDPDVASKYDIVGFDPRGVGSSVPALHCDTSFFAGARPDYIPATKADETVLENRAKAYAADCEKKYGWLLPYMTTEDVARDMDSIRAALGVPQISYFAYSYGTYLGQVYATLFGHRLHRMVLDSVVNPQGAWWTDNIDQDYAFQGRQQAFFTWAAAADSVYNLGSTAAQVSASYYAARGKLKAHPVTVSGSSGQKIGPDELDDTFLIGGYDNSYWPGLAGALSQYLRQGSASQLIQQYQAEGTQNENEFAVYNAVECSDVNWPRSWAMWDSTTRQVYATARFEAWDNAWFNAACAFWPVKGPARPLQIKGAGLPPILMLQGTLDAATPYQGALVAHRLLPSSRMVVVEGGGNHGQSLASPANGCVNGYLNSYLDTGAVPGGAGPANATCPPVPNPVPVG
jgi:pimeloyl-ACP methyl ester carboxylesterase